MKEVTQDTERKLKAFAFNLFEDMQGQEDYPFKTWEEQYEECCTQYRQSPAADTWITTRALYGKVYTGHKSIGIFSGLLDHI